MRLSKGERLIAEGLKKMAKIETKEKEISNNDTEAEILNAYWDAIKSFSDRRFVLNAPTFFACRSKYESGWTKNFIGEERFAFKRARFENLAKWTLVEFYIVDATANSVKSDFIVTEIDKAKELLDGFTNFYNDAFEYANEKMIKETRKEAKEKEEQAYEKALKPVIDDPLFGSW